MIQDWLWTLKPLLLPPGGLILLGLFGWLLGSKVIGRMLIFISLAGLYMLSTPIVADWLISSLEQEQPLARHHFQQPKAQAIVVLAGGRELDAPEYGSDTLNARTLERVRYAAALSRATRLSVIPSGGSPRVAATPEATIIAKVLESEYLAPVLKTETNSRTTWENAKQTKVLLDKLDIKKIYLVTHAWHMPRALYAFESHGIEVIPAPTGYEHKTTDRLNLATDWMPSPKALQVSYYAVHEQLGMIWYRFKREEF
ncbi:MAG: YdcF family protein [Gammaproteobacteria bacterium]|nr:YdcF family protein [Gammaproteobacteria bacterium]